MNLADAKAAVQALRDRPGLRFRTSKYTVGQALDHCAQSLDFSRTGFPENRGWLVQATIGRVASTVMLSRDRIVGHERSAGIPGCAGPADLEVGAGIDRLLAAIDEYEKWDGPVSHFMYGSLAKEPMGRLHALHIADHIADLE